MDAGAEILGYVGTFIAGGLTGAVTAVATFRSSIAVLERADRDRERDMGELRGQVERVRGDLNGIAGKFSRELQRASNPGFNPSNYFGDGKE